MVKKGTIRAKRFAMKYDAYVNMLRTKHLRDYTISLFSKTAYKQILVQKVIDELATTNSLLWGQRGRFYDLAQKMVAGKTVTLTDWLAHGLPEEKYYLIKNLTFNAVNLYDFCKYPTSKLISSISVFPLSFQKMFLPEEDLLTQITTLSEQEAFNLAEANLGVSFLEGKVCAHNVTNFLPTLISDLNLTNLESPFLPILNRSISNVTKNLKSFTTPLSNSINSNTSLASLITFVFLNDMAKLLPQLNTNITLNSTELVNSPILNISLAKT